MVQWPLKPRSPSTGRPRSKTARAAFHPVSVEAAAGLCRMAGLQQGDWLLDLGVGTARLALALAERELVVFGIDLSRPMLEVLDGKDPLRRVAAVEGASQDVSVYLTNQLDHVGPLTGLFVCFLLEHPLRGNVSSGHYRPVVAPYNPPPGSGCWTARPGLRFLAVWPGIPSSVGSLAPATAWTEPPRRCPGEPWSWATQRCQMPRAIGQPG